ncbi:MAG: hypothetical protein AAB296_05105, partial [Candidatus Desantisbacteria bacterium]
CFAGQDSANLDVNVDGYFTQWTATATILLRRTKNQMPCMLMYPYGKGYVIASTLFSDWGYGHNQTSNQEIKLIRDLISWAKDLNKEIPEFKSGDPISLNVHGTNNTDNYANKVILTLIDPDRNIIATQSITTAIPPHQTILIPFKQEQTLQLQTGILWIDYELQDSTGNTIQPQTEGERFTVSKHITGSTRLDGYKIWAVADEHMLKGATATYTIFVRNDTDNDLVGGNIAIGVHEKGGRYWAHIDTITDVTIPAHSQESYAYERKVFLSTSSYFGLYTGTISDTWFFNGAMARCERGVWITEPEVDLDIITDKKIYTKGDTVAAILMVTNKNAIFHDANFQLRVMNPDNVVIFATTTTLTLASTGSASTTFETLLPDDSIRGNYLITSEGYIEEPGTRSIFAKGMTSFQIHIPQSGISLYPPPVLMPHSTSTISFKINNTGLVEIASGSLNAILKAPDNSVIYVSGTSAFGLIPIADSITQSFKIPLGSLSFGVYPLEYTLSYDDKCLSGKQEINYKPLINCKFDKTWYRVREPLKGTLTIINTGVSDIAIEPKISIPAFNYEKQLDKISIRGDSTVFLPIDIIIPANILTS